MKKNEVQIYAPGTRFKTVLGNLNGTISEVKICPASEGYSILYNCIISENGALNTRELYDFDIIVGEVKKIKVGFL